MGLRARNLSGRGRTQIEEVAIANDWRTISTTIRSSELRTQQLNVLKIEWGARIGSTQARQAINTATTMALSPGEPLHRKFRLLPIFGEIHTLRLRTYV